MIREGFEKRAIARSRSYYLIKGLSKNKDGLLLKVRGMPQLFSAKSSKLSRYQKSRYNKMNK